jgi:hypothetical protein
VKLLQQVVHVTLIHLHDPFASTLERQEYDLYAQKARAKVVAASAPGNFQLMEKQGEAAGEGRPRTEGAGSGSWEAAGEGGSRGREAGQLGNAAGDRSWGGRAAQRDPGSQLEKQSQQLLRLRLPQLAGAASCTPPNQPAGF